MPTLTLDFPTDQGEDNILDRIRDKVAYYALPVKTIEQLGDEQRVTAAMKRGTCIWVVYENDYPINNDTDTVGEVRQECWRVWRVLVWARSMRGPRESRSGNEGVYFVSDAVTKIVVGFDPVTNSDTETNYPLVYLGRQLLAESDLSDYLMMLRFAHRVVSEGPI